jgi:hypothetical protein
MVAAGTKRPEKPRHQRVDRQKINKKSGSRIGELGQTHMPSASPSLISQHPVGLVIFSPSPAASVVGSQVGQVPPRASAIFSAPAVLTRIVVARNDLLPLPIAIRAFDAVASVRETERAQKYALVVALYVVSAATAICICGIYAGSRTAIVTGGSMGGLSVVALVTAFLVGRKVKQVMP